MSTENNPLNYGFRKYYPEGSPVAPRADIPGKHIAAILDERWSESQDYITRKNVHVTATTFKMDRAERRRELLNLGKPTGVIIGSFRFKDQIDARIDTFTESGLYIPMPPKGAVTITQGDFPYLEGDDLKIPAEVIEDWYVRNLQAVDFAYIENPNGYVGEMSTIEIGLAMCKGVPMYSSNPLDMDKIPNSIPWKETMRAIKPYAPEQVIEMAKTDTFDTDDYPWFRPWNISGTFRPPPDLDYIAAKEGVDYIKFTQP